jgi:hypothetical protein
MAATRIDTGTLGMLILNVDYNRTGVFYSDRPIYSAYLLGLSKISILDSISVEE